MCFRFSCFQTLRASHARKVSSHTHPIELRSGQWIAEKAYAMLPFARYRIPQLEPRCNRKGWLTSQLRHWITMKRERRDSLAK